MASSDGTGVTAEELKNLYEQASGQAAKTNDIIRVLEVITERDAEEDVTVEEIREDISTLSNAIIVNTKDIFYLHTLLAKLIFEITEQGIKIKNKELLTELKIYLKDGH